MRDILHAVSFTLKIPAVLYLGHYGWDGGGESSCTESDRKMIWPVVFPDKCSFLTLWILVVLGTGVQEHWRMIPTSMKNPILAKENVPSMVHICKQWCFQISMFSVKIIETFEKPLSYWIPKGGKKPQQTNNQLTNQKKPSHLSNRTLKALLSRPQVFLHWLLGFLTLELLTPQDTEYPLRRSHMASQ